jgi:hypothetical protein
MVQSKGAHKGLDVEKRGKFGISEHLPLFFNSGKVLLSGFALLNS